MPIIEKYAIQYRIDPRRLILSASEQGKAAISDQLVKSKAKALAAEGIQGSWKPLYDHYYGGEQK
jgi:hypothetical protein